jgi:hypothetical protein
LIASPRRQLALQLAALLVVMSLGWPLHLFTATEFDWQVASLSTGGIAFLIATLSRQPWWWRLIHLGFAPLAWTVAQWSIDPGWFLLAFVVSLLVYRGALSGQVPLYFSGEAAVDELIGQIESRSVKRFLDLGAGIGSVIEPLARRFPDVQFVAIENSPLPWLLGWIRTRGLRNCDWRWGDLWATELGEFDLVYAFLSPAPMPRLGEKACAEMRPGSLFISNSFALPGRDPDLQIEAGERIFFGYFATDGKPTA